MAVAPDAASRSGTGADNSSFTTTVSWSHPGGTPAGVVVTVTQPLSSVDDVTAVTYGGLPLTRVRSQARTVTEQMRVYLYFLGQGVPAGSQTVQVTGGTASKQAHCFTMTAATTATQVDSDNGADLLIIANPSLTVTHSGTISGWAGYCAHGYGGATPVSTGLQTGETYRYGHDPGVAVGMVYTRHGGAAAASSTYGYTTLTSDDQLLAALVVTELAGVLAGASSTLATSTGTLGLAAQLAGASTTTTAGSGTLASAPPKTWGDATARWGDWGVTWSGVERQPDRSVNVTQGTGTLSLAVPLATGVGWTATWPATWWTTSPTTTGGSGTLAEQIQPLAGSSTTTTSGTGLLAAGLAGDSTTATAGSGTLTLQAPAGAPDAIVAATNLDGTVEELWDDPTAPGEEWLTAIDPMAATDLRVSFPTPSTPPGSGGPRRMVVLARRPTDPTAPDPQVTLELWEAGSFVATLATVTVTSTTGQVVEGTINPASLADPSGAGVQLRVVGVPV